MDRTNSQPKSLPASVGSEQPIEVPDTQASLLPREEPQPPNEPARSAQQSSASGRRNAQDRDDDSPRPRHRRYYDDSDDMIERVRRARAAFEKKTRAFQGPDWPHYEKRIIVGQKKKEPATGAEDSGASQTSQSQNAASTLPVEPDKAKE